MKVRICCKNFNQRIELLGTCDTIGDIYNFIKGHYAALSILCPKNQSYEFSFEHILKGKINHYHNTTVIIE